MEAGLGLRELSTTATAFAALSAPLVVRKSDILLKTPDNASAKQRHSNTFALIRGLKPNNKMFPLQEDLF